MRRPHPDRRRIRLMSEYGAGFPVWDLDATPGGDYLLQAGSLDLTAELTRDLLAWQRLFDEAFRPEHGWRDGAARTRYAALGPQLRDRLQAELGRDVDVVLDLWPVT